MHADVRLDLLRLSVGRQRFGVMNDALLARIPADVEV
jgi:hypothetical protein